MELRQLQYFVQVAKKQHVTKAAELMHVSQSAVSRQIRQLEEELGVTLFVQKGRNLQLTPVGQLFLTRVEQIFHDLESAVDELHEFLDPEAGEIRIGFPHSLGMSVLPQLIANFRQKHPKVRFKLKQGTFLSLIRDVRNGEIDLSLISPLPTNLDNLNGQLLFTEELFAILPQRHSLAGHQSILLEQLKEESFVMFAEGYSLRSIVMEACKKAGFVPKIGFEGEETDMIRGLVAAGMGVSLLPEMALIQSDSFMPVKIKVTDPYVARTIGLIHNADEKLSSVAEVFKKFLVQYYSNNKNFI